MKKRFNITGTCIPHKHYMADTSQKIEKIIAMVEDGEYFTINRPRQYGKTTTMYLLDIVITMGDNKYIIELKVWRGEKYHQNGIEQLCDYLDRQNQDRGYLLIYDMRKESGHIGEYRKIEAHGKEIFAAWV